MRSMEWRMTAILRARAIGAKSRRIRWYHHQLTRIWKKWLARRGRKSNLRWSRFRAMLARHPLPSAKIVHQYAVS